ILLEAASVRPALDIQIANRRRHLGDEEYVGNIGDLEKYVWYRASPTRPEPAHFIYLEKDHEGAITSFNECTHPSAAPHSTCQHKFIEGGLLYKISYNQATFFSEWREQQRRAIEFLRSFEAERDQRSEAG